jgi:RHS repeat-associated protein
MQRIDLALVASLVSEPAKGARSRRQHAVGHALAHATRRGIASSLATTPRPGPHVRAKPGVRRATSARRLLPSTPGHTTPLSPRGSPNRLSATTPSGTVTATYDDQDRLQTYGDFSFVYTANGELQSKTNGVTAQTTLYQYDVLGNLLSVTLPSGTLVEYLIDGQNRRVGKKVNGALTKQWIYRDQLSPVAELDGSGNLVSEFVYGTRSNVPDYVVRGGATYRVFTDHLGSVRRLVNVASSSDVPCKGDYSAFGVVTGTGLDVVPFGFAGGMYDADTGLVRFGARDYDAVSGRWVSKDPIGFGGGQANIYEYSGNDPVNRGDALGTGPISTTLTCVAAGLICGGVLIYNVVSDSASTADCTEVVAKSKKSLDACNVNEDPAALDRELLKAEQECLSNAVKSKVTSLGLDAVCAGAAAACALSLLSPA